MGIDSYKKDTAEMYNNMLKAREEKLAVKKDIEGYVPEAEPLEIEPSDTDLSDSTTEFIMKTLNLPIPSDKYIGYRYNKEIILNSIIRHRNVIADFDTSEEQRLIYVKRLVKIAPYINIFKNIDNIYILNGYGRSGKDSFVRYCNDALQPLHSACYINSIGGIYKITKMFKDVDMLNRNDEDRRFLFDLKKIVTNYCDFCRQYVLQEIVRSDIKGFTHLFIDIRELEEIDKAKDMINAMIYPFFKDRINHYSEDNEVLENVKKYYSVRTLYIDRKCVISDADNPATVTQKFNQYIRSQIAHIENYDYDWIIDNNGTLDDLKETARQFIRTEINLGSLGKQGFKNLKFGF